MKGRTIIGVVASVAVMYFAVGGAMGQKSEAKNSKEGEKNEKNEADGGAEEPGRITIEELKENAEAGDPRALFFLGVRHYEGEDGLEKDAKKAAGMFAKSAEGGFFPAFYSMGLLYLEGEGVKQDDKKASEQFMAAADYGYAPAQSMVAALYEEGRGMKQDDEEAFKWYRRAAWQGDHPAQTSLAYFYANGKGVDLNHRKAAGLFREAAEGGYAPAQAGLGQVYYDGKGVKQDFDKAKEWYGKSAEQRDLWGLNNMAWLLGTCEDETIRDGEKAVEFARIAMEEGGEEKFEILDTLAAALARNGDFEEAGEVQKKAIRLLKEADDMEADAVKEVAVDFEERLKLYEKEKAYVEPAPEPVDEPKEGEEEEEEPKKGRVVA